MSEDLVLMEDLLDDLRGTPMLTMLAGSTLWAKSRWACLARSCASSPR